MNRLRALARVLWQDFKAYRRGDRRVAPRFDVNGRPVGGRVYAKRGVDHPATLLAKTRLKASMILRVYRAATKTWEKPIRVPSDEDKSRRREII